jgi:quinol monooxygenase YgiN
MYSRYTEFRFQPSDREDVLAFWETTALPSASAQPGWRAAYVLESLESDGEGVLRTFTLWDERADFERYRAAPEHDRLGAGIRASGLRITERDGLDVPYSATSGGPLLRITRARFAPEQREAAAAYWTETGAALMRAAPGCLRADAYWADDGTGFTLIAEWAGRDDAERFLSGPEHRAFGAAMDALGSEVVERIVGERIG